MADDLSIRRILDDVKKGQIRVPKFQRDFVWDGERVAYFMDSLYKGYPVGSILLWRTHERLKSEKNLGPFKLPEPEKKMPVDYVLDGQQRITSIYAVFQTDKPDIDESWSRVYFDFLANEDAQESQFAVLESAPTDFKRYFPLGSLYDSNSFFTAMNGLDDDLRKRATDLYERFKESKLPVLQLETEDPRSVAIVFERINRQGVPLDTLQLLTAWTWSDEFDLKKSFEDLTDTLEPFGYEDLGDDDNLLLRCCAALLTGDPGPEKLVRVTGAKVRERFEEVTNGIKGAIDFLRLNAGVVSINNLPFYTVLVPLTVFFAAPGETQVKVSEEQTRALIQWFWRCCFSRRYSSGVLRYLKEDIVEITKLREGKESKLPEIPVAVDEKYFTGNTFRVNAVDTKTLVLMLAQSKPQSLISGGQVGLDDVLRSYNRTEFHHLYPRAALKNSKSANEINCLANFSFLSRVDNNIIGGNLPSIYRSKLQGDITERLKRSFCPTSLFEDDFDRFVSDRTELLVAEAKRLTNS